MLLEAVSLTASGRPVLEAREVELFTLDKVDIEFDGRGGVHHQQAEAYKGGYVVLTSQRMIWLSRDGGSGGESPGVPCWLPLSSIQDAQRKSKIALGGMKIRVHLTVAANFEGRAVSVDGAFHQAKELRLRCRGDAPDALLTKLTEAQAACRSRPEPPAPRAPFPASASASAGTGPTPSGPTTATHAPQMPPPAPAMPAPDESLLKQLTDMGFPRNRAGRALLATSNASCQHAIDYILAFGDQPGMDDPLPRAAPVQHTAYAPAAHSAAGPRPYGTAPHQPGGPPQPGGPLASSASPYAAPYASTAATAYGTSPAYPSIAPGAGAYGLAPYGATAMQRGGPTASHVVAPPPHGVPTFGAAASPYAAAHNPLAPHPAYATAAAHPQGGPVGTAGSSVQVPPPPPPAAMSGVGVAGIVAREERKAEESERTVSAATADLAALMAMASDMVQLAERFRGVMAARGMGNEDELMDADTQMELIAMGITSPVTKETAGSRYTVELSRQLADFLEKPLASQGGIMTLPDVYCLYNRARGSELVSPDDLLDALKAFSKLGLPLSLRSLPSGLPVVQSAAHSEAAVCERIAVLVAGDAQPGTPPGAHLGPAISASDVARDLSVSLPIAREHLLTAEMRGVLCRDDGPEGLRFYNNFFKSTA